MWHSVGKGPIWSFLETEIEKNSLNGQKIKKNCFSHFGVFGHQKHPHVGRMLSIHAQFYTWQ